MRISDWSSDVCSSDLAGRDIGRLVDVGTGTGRMIELFAGRATEVSGIDRSAEMLRLARAKLEAAGIAADLRQGDMYAPPLPSDGRSEEHTSELQSLMRISYAVFCLKKKTQTHNDPHSSHKDNNQ